MLDSPKVIALAVFKVPTFKLSSFSTFNEVLSKVIESEVAGLLIFKMSASTVVAPKSLSKVMFLAFKVEPSVNLILPVAVSAVVESNTILLASVALSVKSKVELPRSSVAPLIFNLAPLATLFTVARSASRIVPAPETIRSPEPLTSETDLILRVAGAAAAPDTINLPSTFNLPPSTLNSFGSSVSSLADVVILCWVKFKLTVPFAATSIAPLLVKEPLARLIVVVVLFVSGFELGSTLEILPPLMSN